MAKVRKFCAYRKLEPRAYTRISKYREKSYIKATPHNNVVRFDMGNPTRNFDHIIELKTKIDCQIRHNALESARQSSNRVLETNLGKKGYFMRIKTFPFHIMRENPLAAGAGADRMSTGMKHSFGNPIGSAARLRKGQTVFFVRINKTDLEFGKTAMKRARAKLPCACQIVVSENKK